MRRRGRKLLEEIDFSLSLTSFQNKHGQQHCSASPLVGLQDCVHIILRERNWKFVTNFHVTVLVSRLNEKEISCIQKSAGEEEEEEASESQPPN